MLLCTDCVQWSVLVRTSFCVYAFDRKSDCTEVSLCWGLTVCGLVLCLACLQLYHTVRRRTYFHLSLAHPEATDCDRNYFPPELWGPFRFSSLIFHSFWISFVWDVPPHNIILFFFFTSPPSSTSTSFSSLFPHVEDICSRSVAGRRHRCQLSCLKGRDPAVSWQPLQTAPVHKRDCVILFSPKSNGVINTFQIVEGK